MKGKENLFSYFLDQKWVGSSRVVQRGKRCSHVVRGDCSSGHSTNTGWLETEALGPWQPFQPPPTLVTRGCCPMERTGPPCHPLQVPPGGPVLSPLPPLKQHTNAVGTQWGPLGQTITEPQGLRLFSAIAYWGAGRCPVTPRRSAHLQSTTHTTINTYKATLKVEIFPGKRSHFRRLCRETDLGVNPSPCCFPVG